MKLEKRNTIGVDMPNTKDKRKIRRAARNISKELYSCGRLEKLARKF